MSCSVSRTRQAGALLLAGLAAGTPVWAEVDAAPVGAPEPAPAARRAWDAAIGGVLTYSPEYAGSAKLRAQIRPGFYVRYGRFSFATRSAFVSGSEPGARGGLRVDLSPNQRLRIGLGLRYDSGRQESSSDALRGLGDVKGTVRVRLGASYPLDEHWRIGSSVTFDAFGRGGGAQGDLNIGRSFALGAATRLGVSAALGYGGDRYMQTYFGITPEQAQRTGYPEFEAPAGLRDIGLGINLRTPLADRWTIFYGGSVSRLIGPAADSPLTRQRSAWGLNAGLVYRF